MRDLTLDRAADAYFTTESVGRTQELTPEGFLLCRDVRIARTGEMIYGEGEVPVEPGRDLIIRITRGPEDLFRPETIASFNGKSVTDDHPDEDVNPDNWRELTVGVVQNVRRGEGVDQEFLLADLLIQDASAIEAVRDGKREVSCGYEADYEQLEPGRGRQLNIIGNHVALVDKGRCGPRCAIGDSEMKTRDNRKRRSWKDRILTAFKARDEEALTEAMEMAEDEMTNGVEGESGPTAGGEHRVVIEVKGPESAVERQEEQGQGVADEGEAGSGEGGGEEQAPAWFTAHVEQNNARFAKIEEALSKLGGTSDEEGDVVEGEEVQDEEGEETEGEAEGDTYDEEGEEGDDDTRARTGDSAGFAPAFQDMIQRAEILAPGIKLPTFDAKASPKITKDRMCAFKRRVILKALDGDDADLVRSVMGGKKADKMTCDALGVAFVAASELVKRANSTIKSTSFIVHDGGRRTSGPPTPAELNARAREVWKGKGGAL